MSPFWLLLELRMIEVDYELDYEDSRQSSSQIITTNKLTPNNLNALLVQRTISQHGRETHSQMTQKAKKVKR